MLNNVPDWMKSFVQDVQNMRDAQNAFFKNKNDYNLKIAKHKEAIVDTRLSRARANGLIDAAIPASVAKQKELPL